MFTVRVFTHTQPNALSNLAVVVVENASHANAMKRRTRHALEVRWQAVLVIGKAALEAEGRWDCSGLPSRWTSRAPDVTYELSSRIQR